MKHDDLIRREEPDLARLLNDAAAVVSEQFRHRVLG